LAGHVDRGSLPGLAYLVAHDGDVHVEVIGKGTFGDSAALPRDAIFRIASLSKPVAAAATMVLVDDGTISLSDPVDALLPELANRRVLRSLESELNDTVPARRAITVEDLLTGRMGFGAVMARPGTYPIQRAESELRLKTLGPPWPPSPHDPDEWMRRFGTLPLIHQPGEGWLYNTGIQVAGILIERAAGKPLPDFMAERIFGPLGMVDTGFAISPSQRNRLTTAYSPDPESGQLSVLDGVDGFWSTPPRLPNAAGWLVSTLDDFWAFVQLLLGKGRYDETRILSQRSVELMTTNHLTVEQVASAQVFLGPDSGWGLGMSTPMVGRRASVGRRGFGWDGGTGCSWRSDVESGLTGILLTQAAMASPEPPAVFVDFWDCAYAALDDRP
jgi:CubicO group peptidase (beta-lactamase class C family)